MAEKSDSLVVKFKEGVADLSEAEVLTFQGDLKAHINIAAAGQPEGKRPSLIDWDKLLQDAQSTGEVRLMAATKVQIDGDTLVFIAPDIPREMRAAHDAAVAATQAYRQGLITAFANILGVQVAPKPK